MNLNIYHIEKVPADGVDLIETWMVLRGFTQDAVVVRSEFVSEAEAMMFVKEAHERYWAVFIASMAGALRDLHYRGENEAAVIMNAHNLALASVEILSDTFRR